MVPSWIDLCLDTPISRWEPAVAFWSEVTDSRISPAGGGGGFVTLMPDRGRSWLKLQAMKEGEGGVHLDLTTSDWSGAVTRGRELGAREARTDGEVVVMCSPGGLPYRHTVGDGQEAAGMHRAGHRAVADQVCIDIPARLWADEVAFWHQLTGRELERVQRPEFVFLGDPNPAGPPRLLLQRLETDAPRVTAHLDFAVADRPNEVRRHERLGSQRRTDFERWTVLRAPSGHVYCLTDRDPATGKVRRPR